MSYSEECEAGRKLAIEVLRDCDSPMELKSEIEKALTLQRGFKAGFFAALFHIMYG